MLVRLKYKRLFVSCLCLVGIGVSTWVGGTQATGYTVQATVPVTTLSQPASFAPGLDGSTVSTALFSVQGSCQMLQQTTVVSIWRQGSSLGSTTCQSGSFSLQVMLVPGNNQLIARSNDSRGQYGPDSAMITVTLKLPAAHPNPGDSGTEPATPAEETQVTNAGAASDLEAQPTTPFGILDKQKNITIEVNIAGGTSPYTINLNWGDGSTEIQTVPTKGLYHFSHMYKLAGNFQIKAKLHDVLGAFTEFSYAVVNPALPKPAPSSQSAMAKGHGSTLVKSVTIGLGSAGAGLFIGGMGYAFGLHQAAVRSSRAVQLKKTSRGRRGKS